MSWPNPEQGSTTNVPQGSDPDGDDRPDLLAVSEHRRIGQLVENFGLDTQAPQRCCHHDGSGTLPTVGDLKGERATVGQPDGVDRLRAVLGDQAGYATDQRRDVPSRPAQPLRIRAYRGGHPGLVRALRSSGNAGESPRQAGQGHSHDRSATAVNPGGYNGLIAQFG